MHLLQLILQAKNKFTAVISSGHISRAKSVQPVRSSKYNKFLTLRETHMKQFNSCGYLLKVLKIK